MPGRLRAAALRRPSCFLFDSRCSIGSGEHPSRAHAACTLSKLSVRSALPWLDRRTWKKRNGHEPFTDHCEIAGRRVGTSSSMRTSAGRPVDRNATTVTPSLLSVRTQLPEMRLRTRTASSRTADGTSPPRSRAPGPPGRRSSRPRCLARPPDACSPGHQRHIGDAALLERRRASHHRVHVALHVLAYLRFDTVRLLPRPSVHLDVQSSNPDLHVVLPSGDALNRHRGGGPG